MAASKSISIAIIGSGGAGALTTGDSLLETACAAGWAWLFTRTLGPQILRRRKRPGCCAWPIARSKACRTGSTC